MSFLRSRGVRFGLLGLLTAFTLLRIRSQYVVPERPLTNDDTIPPQGRVAEIDTGGKVPGNPANAIEDMKRLHTVIDTYRAKHGKFPRSFNALYLAIENNPQDYGFTSVEEARLVWTNPDSRYADSAPLRARPDWSSPYEISDKRPDGTKVGGPKAQGKRDILIYTDLYVHQNIWHFKGERSKSNPVGFFLVMWDDGQIEKIPYDRQLYAPIDKTTWQFALRGQAGVPANAITYDEFYKRLGYRRGPRGEVGGKGESFDSQKRETK